MQPALGEVALSGKLDQISPVVFSNPYHAEVFASLIPSTIMLITGMGSISMGHCLSSSMLLSQETGKVLEKGTGKITAVLEV